LYECLAGLPKRCAALANLAPQPASLKLYTVQAHPLGL